MSSKEISLKEMLLFFMFPVSSRHFAGLISTTSTFDPCILNHQNLEYTSSFRSFFDGSLVSNRNLYLSNGPPKVSKWLIAGNLGASYMCFN